MPIAAMSPNNVAVVTGGASGIGLAAATRFARAGMKICIADLGGERLKQAEAKLAQVAGSSANVMTAAVDVSKGDREFRAPLALLAMEGYAHISTAERQAIHQRVWQRRAYATGSVA